MITEFDDRAWVADARFIPVMRASSGYVEKAVTGPFAEIEAAAMTLLAEGASPEEMKVLRGQVLPEINDQTVSVIRRLTHRCAQLGIVMCYLQVGECVVLRATRKS